MSAAPALNLTWQEASVWGSEFNAKPLKVAGLKPAASKKRGEIALQTFAFYICYLLIFNVSLIFQTRELDERKKVFSSQTILSPELFSFRQFISTYDY